MRCFLRSFFSLIATIVLFLAICVPRSAPLFTGGKQYVYYLYDNHSGCAMINTQNLKPFLLNCTVTGEACVYDDRSFLDVLNEWNAQIVFCESILQISNVYAYSPKIPYKITLQGKIVNLHIAITDTHICVGSPILFGGY